MTKNENCEKYVNSFDTDSDGFIDKTQLQNLLGLCNLNSDISKAYYDKQENKVTCN